MALARAAAGQVQLGDDDDREARRAAVIAEMDARTDPTADQSAAPRCGRARTSRTRSGQAGALMRSPGRWRRGRKRAIGRHREGEGRTIFLSKGPHRAAARRGS